MATYTTSLAPVWYCVCVLTLRYYFNPYIVYRIWLEYENNIVLKSLVCQALI